MDLLEQCFREDPDALQRLRRHTNFEWSLSHPTPPIEFPSEEPDAMEMAMARLNWWRAVEKWLVHLLVCISTSLDKSYDDLAVWNRRSDGLKFSDRINSGLSAESPEEEQSEAWRNWVCQGAKSCSRNSSFCGGYYVPNIVETPTSVQMEHVSHFFQYHLDERNKHYNHMRYLYEHIGNTLLVDVWNKIEHLMAEIDLLEISLPDNEQDQEDQPRMEGFWDDFWTYPSEDEEWPDGTGQSILDGFYGVNPSSEVE